jgi:hypothetical protein
VSTLRFLAKILHLLKNQATREHGMLKYAGLSLCLCLMAMGLNRVFTTRVTAQKQIPKSAQSVTNGSNTPVGKPK